jgi:hypothetical protein
MTRNGSTPRGGALVTGAGRGLGIARVLAGRGYATVHVTDVDAEAAARAATELGGGRVLVGARRPRRGRLDAVAIERRPRGGEPAGTVGAPRAGRQTCWLRRTRQLRVAGLAFGGLSAYDRRDFDQSENLVMTRGCLAGRFPERALV